MKKTFTIETSAIQTAVLAFIDSHCTKDGYLNRNPEHYNELMDMFCEMNKLCWEGNDYTITVSAEG